MGAGRGKTRRAQSVSGSLPREKSTIPDFSDKTLVGGNVCRTYQNGRTEGLEEEGEPHRSNGPAIIYADGRREYWLHGKRSSESAIDAIAAIRPQYRDRVSR